MAEKVYNVRILQKQDSTDKWNSSPVILRNGEIGIEVLDNGKKKIKIGDGTSTWANLDYLETEAAANILDGIANGSIRTSLAAAETADYRMGTAAFASGQNTKAQGNFSKATNFGTNASGAYSSAEGRETQAKGSASHAGGYGTIAGGKNQTVIGKFNVEDTSEEYAFIIGDGEDTNSRANLFTVAWDGEVQVDGKKLATEEYVGQNGGKIDSISVNGSTQTITNKNVNITVPTKTSEITNDSDFATVSQIPTKTSQLTNDSNLATTSQIPTKVSQLENDKNYLTTHQDISGKADKTYVDSQITEANKYTDDSVANLLNNSSEAVDSIFELRDAMEDNADAIEALTTIAGSKVDKVDGKGLSTNDYTTEEKNKLAGIAAGAEVNVQSDWNATEGDALILNKPAIPSKTSELTNDSNFVTEEYVQESTPQSDWNQNEESAPDYIKNKPFGEFKVEVVIGEEITVNGFTYNNSKDYYHKISTPSWTSLILNMEQGHECIVYCDGIRYITKSATSGFPAIGNKSIVYPSEENTGEPFYLEYFVNVDNMEDWINFYTTLEGESHTFSIAEMGEVVKIIPEKYLPEVGTQIQILTWEAND